MGIKVEIELNDSEAIRALKNIEQALNSTEKTAKKTAQGFDAAAKSFIGNLAAIAAIRAFDELKAQILQSFQTFSKFEQGLVNVSKTANLSAGEVEALSKEILRLNKNIPATTEELLDIATAAGQLGIKGTDNLSKFSETVAKLGRVSNLSGDEAATTLTRILNVTRENIGTIDTFGSVIVSLGNNFAATESEIALVTNEVARATAQFGVSSSEAAALSATLRSIGVRAEEAGGVLSTAFIKIDAAIRAGGKGLQDLSKLTGQSGDEIRKQFGEDAIGFFRNFVAGLQRVSESGGDVNKTLAGFDIQGIRIAKVLPVLAKNVGEFDRALSLANAEVKNATALNEEFDKSLVSTTSKTQLFENAVERARIRIGEKLAQAFNKVAPAITDFVDRLGKSEIEIFAESTDDVKVLQKEVDIFKQRIDSLATSPLPEFLKADPTELQNNVKILTDRITELNKEASTSTISQLKAELAELDQQAKNADPILVSIYGTPEQIATRRKEILTTLDNLEKQAILEGVKNVQDGEKAKTDAQINALNERNILLQELQAASAEIENQKKIEAEIAKQIESEKDLQFLADNLGKENAIRELAKIKQIDDEKKRITELRKLKDKAIEEDKASLIDLQKFENLTNKQKVEAQRQTLQTIASLSNSNNSTLFAIGKAASLALAGINVSEGVTKALAAFPPPFNFAAATAVGAAGAVQIAQIASAKKPNAGSFEEGGIVGGNSFTGDRLQANVNSGEAIFNRRQQQNLFNAIDSGNIGGAPSVTINNPLLLDQGGIDTLIEQINDAIEFRNKSLRTA